MLNTHEEKTYIVGVVSTWSCKMGIFLIAYSRHIKQRANQRRGSRDNKPAAKVHSALFTLKSVETAASSVHTIKIESAGRSSNTKLIGDCFLRLLDLEKSHALVFCPAYHIIAEVKRLLVLQPKIKEGMILDFGL